jgi:hypothetical protein
MDMRDMDMEEEALEREDRLRRSVGVTTRSVLLEEVIVDMFILAGVFLALA